MGVICLAFQFDGPLARLLQFDARCIVEGPTIAEFVEGTFQTCNAIAELLESNIHIFARALQLVLTLALKLLGLCQLVQDLLWIPHESGQVSRSSIVRACCCAL